MESWEKLNHRLSTSVTSPPFSVYLLVHTLTGGADVQDSYAEMQSGESTTVWRNWVLTDSSLVYTQVEFAAPNHDREAEDRTSYGNPNDGFIEPSVTEAWSRPLQGVTALHIGAIGKLAGHRNDWYPVGRLFLTFDDGSRVELPGQLEVASHARDRSDQFLNTVRSRINI